MSTNQFRRYLDLLNEADLVPPNTTVAPPSSDTFSNDQALANLAQKMAGGSEPRCAVCGTPQSQHQQLQHQFVAGNDTQPAPVAQGGSSRGDVGRVRQLQAELKAAGANLGATGPNRDGIDGDIGPLTIAAMAKYPDISAKYADLGGAPAAQAATPAVDTSKLTSALSAIETVIAKYKGKTKVTESLVYEANGPLSAKAYQDRINQTILPDPVVPAGQATPGFQQPKIQKRGYVPPAAVPAQSVYNRFNTPSPAPVGLAKAVELKTSGWASRAGQAILSKLPGLGARTATRAGATALSGPLAPLVGLAGAAYTVWDVGNMLYDAYKDSNNLEGMNDADQAVVKQNLPVVLSFIKDPKIANTLPQDVQARVVNIMADLEKLAVDTGYNTPIAQTSSPMAAPAVSPALKTTADGLDKLLKKYNFESREPRTLSQQMARDRDIVNEGPVAKAVGNWALDAIKPIATRTLQGGTVVAGGVGTYKGYQALTAPTAMSTADQAEFTRLLAEFKKTVPDQAAFDALPPDVQQQWIQLYARVQQVQKTQGNK